MSLHKAYAILREVAQKAGGFPYPHSDLSYTAQTAPCRGGELVGYIDDSIR